MFVAVTGFVVGKNKMTLMNTTHVQATRLIGLLQIPIVYGPGMNCTRFSYTRCAMMTAT